LNIKGIVRESVGNLIPPRHRRAKQKYPIFVEVSQDISGKLNSISLQKTSIEFPNNPQGVGLQSTDFPLYIVLPFPTTLTYNDRKDSINFLY
jgi:hypothetical protein